MSRVSGYLVTCSRCGATIFLKKLETRTTDGGYTRYDVMEELPDDWLPIYELGGHLCPECSKEFKKLIHNFMGGCNIVPRWDLYAKEKQV